MPVFKEIKEIKEIKWVMVPVALKNINMNSKEKKTYNSTLRAPAAPYTAILLRDRILLNIHVIVHYTIPKPYIHWKGMILSRHQCIPFADAISRP